MPILDEAMHLELLAELAELESRQVQRKLLIERALERAKALDSVRTIMATHGEHSGPQDTADLLRELAEELKHAARGRVPMAPVQTVVR